LFLQFSFSIDQPFGMFRRQITVGYPNRALAAAISSGLSSRVRKAALKLGGTAMASTSGSSKNLGEHDDRKPGSYQSAAEVVGKSAEHPDREKDGLVLPRKLPGKR